MTGLSTTINCTLRSSSVIMSDLFTQNQHASSPLNQHVSITTCLFISVKVSICLYSPLNQHVKVDWSDSFNIDLAAQVVKLGDLNLGPSIVYRIAD